MDIAGALELAAAVVGTSAAAWGTWLSPSARRRREAAELQARFHRDWQGIPERRGAAGGVEQAAVPGVMERLAYLEHSAGETKAKLSAPILNGRGDQMLEDFGRVSQVVQRVDGRGKRHGTRLTAVELQVASGFAAGAKRMDRLDQRLEARFAEQTAVIAEVMTPEQ